jgi:hypothetical protein
MVPSGPTSGARRPLPCFPRSAIVTRASSCFSIRYYPPESKARDSGRTETADAGIKLENAGRNRPMKRATAHKNASERPYGVPFRGF